MGRSRTRSKSPSRRRHKSKHSRKRSKSRDKHTNNKYIEKPKERSSKSRYAANLLQNIVKKKKKIST